MSDLHEERSIWVTAEQFGTVQTLELRGRQVKYRLPKEIQDVITLRFKDQGITKNGRAGDLLLHVRLYRGADVDRTLWICESAARSGGGKRLRYRDAALLLTVPPASVNGQVIRLPGYGEKPGPRPGFLLSSGKCGDLLVKLRVYPDAVSPSYRSVDYLQTADLALEGWMYRRLDYFLERIDPWPFGLAPFPAVHAADTFNEEGWLALANLLVERLGLENTPISFRESSSLAIPGQCERRAVTDGTTRARITENVITIRSEFVNDPFAVVAIIAHELCHILEARHSTRGETAPPPKGAELLEMERSVDLLAFLFGLGEFQMRVARQSRMTLGYFNQDLFERMYSIVSRKKSEHPHPPRPQKPAAAHEPPKKTARPRPKFGAFAAIATVLVFIGLWQIKTRLRSPAPPSNETTSNPLQPSPPAEEPPAPSVAIPLESTPSPPSPIADPEPKLDRRILPPEEPLPENGKIYTPRDLSSAGSKLRVVPESTSKAHILVKVEDWNNSEFVGGLFIRAGESAEMNIPPGTYRLKFASGKNWYGSSYFGPDTSYSSVTSPVAIADHTHHTINLKPNLLGTLNETKIGPKDF